MAKKKSKKAELKKSLGAARRELVKSESAVEKAKAKADRWKAEATQQRKAAARAVRKVERLQVRLAEASPVASPDVSLDASETTPTEDQATGAPAETGPSTPAPSGDVDASWTIVQLRAEVARRGLTGMSRKPKAELLRALS